MTSPPTQTLIALETSGTCCGVALLRARGDAVQVQVREHTGVQSHAERLLPMLDALLVENGVVRADIGAVAFGQGPGGFTGLRVAAGVAQGLALALDVPVLPVASLRAVASQVALHADEVAVVVLDARMDELYLAAYAPAADGHAADPTDRAALHAPVLLAAHAAGAWSAAQLPRWSQAAGRSLAAVAVGAGWAVAGATVPPGWRRAGEAACPNVEQMARLGWRDWRAGLALTAEAAQPLYVRDKVAYTSAERARGQGGNPRADLPAPDLSAPAVSVPASVSALPALDAEPLIAPMTVADLAEVVALEASVQAQPWSHGNFADALAAGYSAWVLRENPRENPQTATQNRAHATGRLLGFAVLMVAPDVAHVLTIAVARAAQRRGYGQRLLDCCAAQARRQGAAGLLLEVRVSNSAARAFYERAGFVQMGLRRGYYRADQAGTAREDALVLQKPLENIAPSAPEPPA